METVGAPGPPNWQRCQFSLFAAITLKVNFLEKKSM